MKRRLTRRRALARLVRTGAGAGLVALVPVLAAGRRRVRLAGTRIRIRTRALGPIGPGSHLAG